MKKSLFILLAIVLFASVAYSYSFESEFDPKEIFTYEILGAEQLSQATVLLTLKSEEKTPKFVIACMMNRYGKVIVVAYAYLDKDLTFKHYMFDGLSHYGLLEPDENTKLMLIKRLKMLNGIEHADKNGKKTDV